MAREKNRIIEYVKKATLAYAIVANFYGLGADTTGHRSSDLHLGKAPLTHLEQFVLEDCLGREIQ